jgi:hypothetical protein
LVTTCCLALRGLASSALAEIIVVTTLDDTADPPFDADGLCGTGTISDLPGDDGFVSLREAIIAANNTPGADTITFRSGGTIEVNFDVDADGNPDPLPALCGGQTRIKGDLDGDDAPDITLEGMALPTFPPVAGLLVISSHNTIQGLQVQHFPFGIVATAAGSDTQITHTTITNNEVTGNRFFGIYMVSLGDRNVFSHATIAHNTVSGNTLVGIMIQGGFGGADENTLDVNIKDNTVTDNGAVGINVWAGRENSSHNHVIARIGGNTVERHQIGGIQAVAALGALNSPGTSNHNVLDVRIARNTVAQADVGILVSGGEGSPDGRTDAFADDNQTTAVVAHNTVEGSTFASIGLVAGDIGLASANTTEVRVAHNTVCNNAGTDIIGEGGYSGGDILFPVPNQGTGNVLEGRIFQNTATTVTVQDGAGAPGNRADVTQFHNDPCP